MNRIAALFFVLFVFALSGCTPPVIQALHAPFHPGGREPVTFLADAQAPEGVVEISIWRKTFEQQGFCAAWVAGKCVPLPTPKETVIKTCAFEERPTTAHCEVTAGPFGDGSFVTYGARIRDGRGLTAEDQWIGFAVGAQADPNEPVAVYTRDGSDSSIDIVLIPVDFNGAPGRTYRDFVTAARGLIAGGYLPHAQITNQRARWNFYVNPVTGGLLQSNVGGTVTRSVTQPANWSHIAPLADTVAYVHNNAAWRDFANFGGSGIGHFTIDATTPGTIVHETGHALFGLSDEYCCDGGTIATSWPHANLFQNLAACQTSAGNHGVATGACTQITTTVGFCGGNDASGNPVLGGTNLWWRQDGAGDLMGCGGNGGAAGGVLDAARIDWFYTQF